VAVVVVAAGACGGGGGSSRPAAPPAGCTAAVQEHLDPRSTAHLFPGAAEPTYLTDPPTSGPHQLGPPVTGVATASIPRPRQVAMLESGFVLLQYRDLAPAEVATLGTLAGDLVTVAPAAGPLPNRVVATAWSWKEVCGSVGPASLTALRAFVTARRGKGFQ
jgi:hypothetical protein